MQNPIPAVAAWVDRFQRAHPWTAFPVAVVRKYGDDQAGSHAALLAYYAFFSVFPLLLVAVSVLAIALRDNPALQQRVLQSGLGTFPVLGSQLRVHSLNRSGLALVIGLVGAFIGARGLADAAQTAFNTLWQVPFNARPGFPASLLRSAGVLLDLAAGAAVSGFTAAALANTSGGWLGHLVVPALGFAASCGLFVLGFRLVTAGSVTTAELLPGAVVAAAGWQVLLAIGGLVVTHYVNGADQVYGAFATVIGLLAWFSLQTQLTLYAVEVDVVRAHRLWPRSLSGPPWTPADERAFTSYAQAQTRVPGQQITVRFEPAEVTAVGDSGEPTAAADAHDSPGGHRPTSP